MYKKYLILLLSATCSMAYAVDDELVNQQQARDYLNQKQQIDQFSQDNVPFIHLQQTEVKSAYPWLKQESVCFQVRSVEMFVPKELNKIQVDDFYLALKELKYSKHKVLGHCIGEKGLAGVVNFVNEQLIQLGYVSTQVILPEQDLSTGDLKLQLVPGLIGQIRLKNEHSQNLNYRLPIRQNDILNIRELEQILETFSRLDGVQATFDLLPSQVSGELASYTDVVINWQIIRRQYLNVGFNDAGSESSGKYQGYVGYTIENPLNFADSLFLYYTQSLNKWNIDHTDFNNLYAAYEVPYRDWLINLNASQYKNTQELDGGDHWIDYQTVNKDVNFKVQKELNRSKYSRFSGYLQGYRKSVSSYIDDVEILVQRKRTAGWEIGGLYQLQIGQQTLHSQLSYKKGTNAFGAGATAEDITGEGNSRASIWNASLQYSLPWQTQNNAFLYQANWQGQWSPQDLISQELFSIGGRYTVRGYSTDQSIVGNNGHYLQQTMYWLDPVPYLSIYTGLDQGLVTGIDTQYYSDRYLLGGVVGVRANFPYMNGEFFVGRGLSAPDHIKKEMTTGFNLSFNF